MVSAEMIDAVVRRVVETAHPEKIILFGSAARGDADAKDIDLLVVKSDAHRRHTAMDIYERLIGLDCSVDVVVVTPQDIERYGDQCALVIEPALREGKVVYAS